MTGHRLGAGQVIGDYAVASVAGEGGMGVVYKATQRSLERVVALKVIRDEIGSAPEYRERFLREARLAASVDHPNVVTVYDVGDESNQLFLAMQWIDGEDLKALLARSGRLAPSRAVAIVAQVASALDAVHSVAGLIHRDVKPGNVLLGQVAGKDHAYLTDFGVAKPSDSSDHLTRTGWVVGTAGYLSPEQIRGQEPGPRSDLYALGCLFFETVTGEPPFHGDNEMALRWAHANDPRPRASAVLPALGTRYDDFLAVALAIDPEHRFPSGNKFTEALMAAHGGEGTSGLAEAAATAMIAVPRTPTAIGPPTPMPPPPHTPPPGYSPYGYGTPPPAPPQTSKAGNPLALILLALVAFAGIAVGALAATGVLSKGASTRSTTAAGTTAPQPVVAHRKAKRKRKALPARTSPCGGGLSVGPDTSCPFAKNVEEAYLRSSGGDTTVTAYSPTTGITYQMHCTAEPPHVCTGGKGAAVYFNASPHSASPSSYSAPAASPPGLQRCDQNISASQVTSCPFAENVFIEYWRSYRSSGVQQETTVSAYSSTKNQNYEMNCYAEAGTVNCSGGKEAFVTFPLHAVEIYEGPHG
jgi:serine/threonine protein kinase